MKEYKEKDREDGGRMVKRWWRGRRDTRGLKSGGWRGGIREGVNMEKDGDSEEDNDEEVVKQVVKRRFEGRG